jgi:CheY-like chemotaxis protein
MSHHAPLAGDCARYPNLTGKRILVVDDEPVVSVDYRYQLLEVGATPAGFVPSNQAAMSFLETHEVDGVIVDYRLQDGTSEPVVAWLVAHQVPFVMVSGWVEKLKWAGPEVPVLEKPAPPVDLWQALSAILH